MEVRMRSIHGRLVLAGLCVFLVSGCGTPDPGATGAGTSQADPPELTVRHVPLEGQSNFRDLGGYETADGRTVKWGEVYRSGELPDLTDADVARLETLGLRAVANFLLPEEIDKSGRDRLPEGVREIPLAITSERTAELSLAGHAAIESGDFSTLPPELNPEIHRLLLDDAKVQYAALLRELADPASRPMAFHCSHGVHRTGTAAAVLLSALGVPWETVREDYLLTNEYRKDEVEHRLAKIRSMAAAKQGLPPEQVDMTNMEAFYIVQGAYIDGSLEQAVQKYGSMEGYIRDGLGISDEEVERLRTQLLE
jgi:protein-tyrosine phosphatase